MNNIEFENGYPTQETLDFLKQTRHYDDDIDILFEELKLFVNKNGKLFKDGYFWIFVTGEWSGNEDIVNALYQNKIFWMQFWEDSFRGGKYVFRIIGRYTFKPKR